MHTCFFSTMDRLVRMAAVMTIVLSTGASASCWEDAARAQGVDPWLLYGIASVESSLNPHALNLDHLSRTGSYDIGLMQINSRNLPALAAYGIAPNQLWNACTSIHVGARILREKLDRYGDTWEAVGTYPHQPGWPARILMWDSTQVGLLVSLHDLV